MKNSPQRSPEDQLYIDELERALDMAFESSMDSAFAWTRFAEVLEEKNRATNEILDRVEAELTKQEETVLDLLDRTRKP